MIILTLFVLGLCLGSFVNAWVWRVHRQSTAKSVKSRRQYSILHGRSMCPHCKHTLGAQDLVPLFSWLYLKGKCRYCSKLISSQYPAVELLTALLFVGSYLLWPFNWSNYEYFLFGFWLIQLTILVALAVYDLRWYLLPNRMVITLVSVVGVQMVIQLIVGVGNETLLLWTLAAAVGGGFFWILFQMSGGRWIGGGDVKLGAVLGLIVGTPMQAFLVLFLASILGLIAALPLLLTKRMGRNSQLPFGPFLILSTIVVRLFGPDLVNWYMRLAGL